MQIIPQDFMTVDDYSIVGGHFAASGDWTPNHKRQLKILVFGGSN